MAQVFEAVDARTGELVALKVLHAHLAETSEVVSRFVREGRALEKLQNPNIVRVLDHGITDAGDPWIAMERLQGGSLDALIRIEGHLEPARALRLARDVAVALSGVHAHGMVHRDIKPENIFVVHPDGPSEVAKLIDFGIARVSFEEMGHQSVRYTRANIMLGTAAFVAPEQALGEKVDARADVFSLGVTLYEMLTGRLPYEGTSVEVQLKARLDGAAVPIQKRLGQRVSPAIAMLLERALSREPGDRPADGAAMVEELEVLQAEEASAPPRRSSMIPAPKPVASSAPKIAYADAVDGFTLEPRLKRRRTLLLVVFVATCLVALLAAGTLAVLRALHAIDP